MAQSDIVALTAHIAALEAAAREKDKDAKALRIQFKVDQSRLEAMKDAQERREPDDIIKESGYAALIHEALTNPMRDRQRVYNQVNRNLIIDEQNKLIQFYTDSRLAFPDRMSNAYYQYKEQVLRKTECETLDAKYIVDIAAVRARKGMIASELNLDIPHLEIIQTGLDGLLRAQKTNREELASISLVLPVLRLTTPNPIWIDLFDLLMKLFKRHIHEKRRSGWGWNESEGYAERNVTVTLPAEVANMLPRLASGVVGYTEYVFPICMPTVFVLTNDGWSSFREDQRLLLAGFGVILEFRDNNHELRLQYMSPCRPQMYYLPKK